MLNEELCAMIQAGTDAPKNLLKLYQQNLPLLRRFCRKYAKRMELEDALQEAFLPLMRTAEVFDSGAGYRYTTLLKSAVKNHLWRANRRGVSQDTRELCARYQRLQEQTHAPSDSEICDLLQISPRKLQELRNLTAIDTAGSLDLPLAEDTESTIGDLIPDPSEPIEDRTIDALTAPELWKIVADELPESQSQLIHDLFQNGRTAEAIAKQRGCTPQAVADLKRKALRRLRDSEAVKRYADYRDGAKAYRLTPEEIAVDRISREEAFQKKCLHRYMQSSAEALFCLETHEYQKAVKAGNAPHLESLLDLVRTCCQPAQFGIVENQLTREDRERLTRRLQLLDNAEAEIRGVLDAISGKARSNTKYDENNTGN